MGITLTDVTGQINAFIFSPDAEKHIPYSAIELKEVDDQEYTLTLELAESVAKHTITCFVRYYEQDTHGNKELRYNIVKAYTTEELLRASHMHANEESTYVDSENIAETYTTLATAATKNVGPSILPLTPTKKPTTTQYSLEASPSKKQHTQNK
ncbi:hypothetical protein ACH5RR_023362 [Cinchona calisaya]|uniref:Uncharacterized protein n=1 Tax=Cinchona calisaya TaxID=153742 RepID=A0ABD2ZDQ9_9GENT